MNSRGRAHQMSKSTSKFQLINDYAKTISSQPMRCTSALKL
jgi:hypothetical protein